MALPTLSNQFSERRSYDVHESDPLSGFYDRGLDNQVRQREWTIRWPLLIEGAQTVRFLDDRLSVNRASSTKYSATIKVAQEPAGMN